MIIIMWSTKSRFNTLASVEHSRFEPLPPQGRSPDQERTSDRRNIQAEDREELNSSITPITIIEVKRHPGDDVKVQHEQRASHSQLFLALRNQHQHGEYYLFAKTNDNDEQTYSSSPPCRIP